MNKIVKLRIDEHIKKNMPIAKVHVSDDDFECGYCGTAYADVEPKDRPNFCPECGALLDWSNAVYCWWIK